MYDDAMQVITKPTNACVVCHKSGGVAPSNYVGLTQQQWIDRGYIVPGNAASSQLYKRIISTGTDVMPPPPFAKLSATDQAAVRDWINSIQATPIPTPVATPTPTPSPTPTPKPVATPTPTPMAGGTVATPTPTPKPTASPTPAPVITPIVTPGPTPTCFPTAAPMTLQPTPIPAYNVTTSFVQRDVVAGTLGGPNTREYSIAFGETRYIKTPKAAGKPDANGVAACPSSEWTPQFGQVPVPAGEIRPIIVAVWGTPDAFDNAIFSFGSNRGSQTTGVSYTVSGSLKSPYPSPYPTDVRTLSKSCPANYDKLDCEGMVTQPAQPAAQYPFAYFVVNIPVGTGAAPDLTMSTTKNGTLWMRYRTRVRDSEGKESVMTPPAQQTVYRPRLKFQAQTYQTTTGKCSGAAQPIVLNTVDGNGNIVSPLYGTANLVTAILNGGTGDLFMDSDCVYSTSQLYVNDPPSAGPHDGGSSRPASTQSVNTMTLYYKQKTAGTMSISAVYRDTNTLQMNSATTTVQILPLPPDRFKISGPTGTNQNKCSQAYKVTLVDSAGNDAKPVQPVSVKMSLSPTARAYSDAACTTPLNMSAISVSTSSFSFYVVDTAAEDLPVNLSASGMQTFNVKSHILASDINRLTQDPAVAEAIARLLFERLSGVTATVDNATEIANMKALILQGKVLDAARIASSKDGFINITLKNMVTPLSNRLLNPLHPLNDFTATWLGIVRDDHDARELLTGNHIYVSSELVGQNATDQTCASSTVYKDNSHYQSIRNANLAQKLKAVPQCVFNGNSVIPRQNFQTDVPTVLTDAAGLLTTRTWGEQHLFAGTNRRGIEFTFKIFLAKDIQDLADTSTPEWHIRRDVSRAPAGDANRYNFSCRGCHGGMDALGGAFAFFDAYENPDVRDDFRLFYVPKGGYGEDGVMPKMNINNDTSPWGWKTGDDSWINLWTEGKNKSLEWSTDVQTQGNGIHELGTMLANSKQFARGMAIRVFKEVCKRPNYDAEAAIIDELARDFMNTGYNMRRLFEKAAIQPVCLGAGK